MSICIKYPGFHKSKYLCTKFNGVIHKQPAVLEHVFYSSSLLATDFSVVFHSYFLSESFIKWEVHHFEADG